MPSLVVAADAAAAVVDAAAAAVVAVAAVDVAAEDWGLVHFLVRTWTRSS